MIVVAEPDFLIKKDDLLPTFDAVLLAGKVVVDLTAASSVRFIMRKKGATVTTVDAAATIVTPAAGLVRYTWVVGDTDDDGEFDGEFEVLWPGSKPETYPNGGHLSIRIYPDLGGVI